MNIKICHITSAHGNRDIRIFVKECTSLANVGYQVFLVAFGDSRFENGVQVIGLGSKPKTRKERMIKSVKHVYNTAMALDCDIYHFHDPELLPYGLKMKKAGKKVIFDSHEDIPAQIIDKYWIPTLFRRTVSKIYKQYETYIVKRIDAVIAATPHIAQQFTGRAKNVVVVNNYPKLDDIDFADTPFCEREQIICYAGVISVVRGEQVMIKAMKHVNGSLVLAGNHSGTMSRETTRTNVEYLGNISRKKVNSLYGKSQIGLVLFQPAANHFESQPNKMYEYMAAGLPFVASDFPLWRGIVEENNCGVCVDPTSPFEVANAIKQLLCSPEKAQQMGLNGRRAVLKKYNWDNEAKVLVELYGRIQ